MVTLCEGAPANAVPGVAGFDTAHGVCWIDG